MKQREIYYADLNPGKPGKRRNRRPVVIISGNIMNEHLDFCIVCPLSTNVKKYAGCVVLKKDKVNKLKQNSEIITYHVRTITKDRLTKKIGEITEAQLIQAVNGLIDVLKY